MDAVPARVKLKALAGRILGDGVEVGAIEDAHRSIAAELAR